MKIQDIRRVRLAQLINSERYGSQSVFVEQTGENQGEISALLRDKSFGEKKARKIEAKCELPEGWLDGDRDGQASNNASTGAARIVPARDAVKDDEITVDEMLELFNYYRTASPKDRKQVFGSAKTAAERELRRRAAMDKSQGGLP